MAPPRKQGSLFGTGVGVVIDFYVFSVWFFDFISSLAFDNIFTDLTFYIKDRSENGFNKRYTPSCKPRTLDLFGGSQRGRLACALLKQENSLSTSSKNCSKLLFEFVEKYSCQEHIVHDLTRPGQRPSELPLIPWSSMHLHGIEWIFPLLGFASRAVIGCQSILAACSGVGSPGVPRRNWPPWVPWTSRAWFFAPKSKLKNVKHLEKSFALFSCQQIATALLSCQKIALALLSCKKICLALLSCQ